MATRRFVWRIAFRHLIAGGEEGAGDGESALTLISRQIAIAAAHGQAIAFADRRARDDLDGEVEGLGHGLQDAKLLEIL